MAAAALATLYRGARAVQQVTFPRSVCARAAVLCVPRRFEEILSTDGQAGGDAGVTTVPTQPTAARPTDASGVNGVQHTADGALRPEIQAASQQQPPSTQHQHAPGNPRRD